MNEKTLKAATNSGLAKGGLTCFVETLVLKIPPIAKPFPLVSHNISGDI